MSKPPDQEGLESPVRAPYNPGDYFDTLIQERASLYRKTALVRAVQMEHDFSVETLEGTMRAKTGDYLCKGQDGEYWPVKNEIFQKIYEEVIE